MKYEPSNQTSIAKLPIYDAAQGGGVNPSESKKGFSLTEVLVGVALISVLSGVAIGTFNHFSDLAWARAVKILRGKIEKAVQRCMVDSRYDYKQCDGIETYVVGNAHPQSVDGAEPIIKRELGIEFDSSKFKVWAQGPEQSDGNSSCFTIVARKERLGKGHRACVDFNIKTGDIGHRWSANQDDTAQDWNRVRAFCRGKGVCCRYNASWKAAGGGGNSPNDACEPPPVTDRCKTPLVFSETSQKCESPP